MAPSIPDSAVHRVDAWRVDVSPFRDDMRTGGRVYADEALFSAIRRDQTLDQICNVAALPGIVGSAMAMPDAHQGYGFPIGGVAATDVGDEGAVSPGGVGFDINCGVRLLATDVQADGVRERVSDLIDAIFKRVPVGFAKKTALRMSDSELDEVLERGAHWVVEQGLGTDGDLAHTEEGGAHPGADPDAVSDRAKARGRGQLGSLGSGNHFVEVQRVDTVLQPEAAEAFGLQAGQLVVLIHTGSRGVGHQVCSDAVARFRGAMKRHGWAMPDKQLACAPVDSEDGRLYLGGMFAAANYAWANRQVITHAVREALQHAVGDVSARVIYDVAHNMAKLETHTVDGRQRRVCVHRKGATRAFPRGHEALPAAYRDIGQPVFIPGSMGTASYVLVGTDRALAETFGSVCHGAGRTMSRTRARKTTTVAKVKRDLRRQGITIRSGSKAGIVEEFPGAYKDVHNVIDVVQGAGLATAVARLAPLGVVKG